LEGVKLIFALLFSGKRYSAAAVADERLVPSNKRTRLARQTEASRTEQPVQANPGPISPTGGVTILAGKRISYGSR
jgi:hypothetical protein